MGAHILIRKKGMTRQDIQRILASVSFLDIACFLKETRYDDFMQKLGNPAHGLLPPSPGSLDDIPDEWIDYDGDIVFNSAGLSALEEIERVLGFTPPVVDSDNYDFKRSRGGAIHLVRGSPKVTDEDPGEWMTAEELRSRLATVAPPKDGPSWVLGTFQAIADNNFDCRILV